jgi:hypothetical protein
LLNGVVPVTVLADKFIAPVANFPPVMVVSVIFASVIDDVANSVLVMLPSIIAALVMFFSV